LAFTETYKSLITLTVEALKMLALVNGGAAIAILTYVGNLASRQPTPGHLPDIRFALWWYCGGVAGMPGRLRGQAIDPVRQGPSTEERMDLILIVLILILLFGGGFGYSRWGYGGGIGIGGILLIVLVVYLLVGHGRL
jgi:hypothetical protein